MIGCFGCLWAFFVELPAAMLWYLVRDLAAELIAGRKHGLPRTARGGPPRRMTGFEQIGFAIQLEAHFAAMWQPSNPKRYEQASWSERPAIGFSKATDEELAAFERAKMNWWRYWLNRRRLKWH